jgi:hypothetical protein
MKNETTEKKQRNANSTYKKLAVQWLNEVQFFNQTFVQVDSFVLRNRQLLIAANRYVSALDENRQSKRRQVSSLILWRQFQNKINIHRFDLTKLIRPLCK